MSKTSMRERNKAIQKAWEREQQLVHEGHGTRDWTEEQQQDILNPDKGKAYDKQGRAFEGQHMKSAAEYPEYQGNPDNIQFLTKDEHLEAHKGSWQKPTNWYYDPVAKDFTVFGKDELIPCAVIALSKPVVTVVPKLDPVIENTENSPVSEIKRERASLSPEKIVEMSSAPKNIKTTAPPKSGGKLIGGLKAVGRFIVNHPIESLEIACVVIGGVAKLVSSFSGSRNSSGSHTSSTSTSSGSSSKTDIVTKVADIVEKANRALPGENDVSRHKQRYHTKDGIVWRDKAPYHRGGKNS